MAKRSFHNSNWTPSSSVADGSALANATYMAVKCNITAATQLINISEVYIAGMAGASSPTFMCLARAGALETTPTALAAPASDGPLHPATAALTNAPVTFTAAATGPTRSSATTDTRLELGLNAFGGIVRWVAYPGEEWSQTGTTAPLAESVLSSFNQGTPGLLNAHIVYEPF